MLNNLGNKNSNFKRLLKLCAFIKLQKAHIVELIIFGKYDRP